MANPFEQLFDYSTVFPEQPTAQLPWPPGQQWTGAVTPPMQPPVAPPAVTPRVPGPMSGPPDPYEMGMLGEVQAPQVPEPTSGFVAPVYEPQTTDWPEPTVTPATRFNAADFEDIFGRLEGGRWDRRVPSRDPNTGRIRNALGMFGIMDFNLPEWSMAALGRRVSEQEFLANPAIQRQIFRHRFGVYLDLTGDPREAAAMWIGGPRGRANRARDAFGTNVDEYVRRFDALYPGTGGAPPPPRTEVAGGRDFVDRPPQLSDTGNTLMPGWLSNLIAPAQPAGVPNDPYRPSIGYPLYRGSGGSLTDWGHELSGIPSRGQFLAGAEVRGNEAETNIIRRGRQLAEENPTATPEQLARMLIRDPTFGENMLFVSPARRGALIGEAVQRLQPPMTQVAPGGIITTPGPDGRPTELFRAPTTEMQTLQGLTGAGGQLDQEAMRRLSMFRTLTAPMDRAEQALDEMVRSGTLPQWFAQARRAGLITVQPHRDQYGATVGYNVVYMGPDPSTGQMISRVIAGPAAGSGVTPPPVAPGVTPPAGPPPTGGVPPSTDVEPWTGAPPTTQPPAGQPPGPPNLIPRRVGRMNNRDVLDVPELGISTSAMGNPAEMFLAAGAQAYLTGQLGRIAGQIPGFQTTGENVISRQIALRNLRTAVAQIPEGRSVRAEHESLTALVPTENQIIENPLSAVLMGINLREALLRRYTVALHASNDQSLSEQTRREASSMALRVRYALVEMPTMQQMFELAGGIRGGGAETTTLPGAEAVRDFLNRWNRDDTVPDMSRMNPSQLDAAHRALPAGDPRRTAIEREIERRIRQGRKGAQ